MIIAADTQIPFVETACRPLGELRLFEVPDPSEVRALCMTADVLLCRSTLRVDADLLEGTPVKFVATATSGTDHFDIAWMDRTGVSYASAAGSNARSVAEYVFAALLELGGGGRPTFPSSIGIIGAGHVGTAVAEIAGALGMDVVLSDPPLRDLSGDSRYRPLEEALDAEAVTLHVPLTGDGAHPTSGMIAQPQFAAMRPGAIFLNTSRGGVVDIDALHAARSSGQISSAVLDVFPNEPMVDTGQFNGIDIVTPHIAGHSTDGKLRGTAMVTAALGAWCGTALEWDLNAHVSPIHIPFGEDLSSEADLLRNLVRSTFDIRLDDADLRSLARRPAHETARRFAEMRRKYRPRAEFPRCIVSGKRLPAAVRQMAEALGFRV